MNNQIIGFTLAAVFIGLGGYLIYHATKWGAQVKKVENEWEKSISRIDTPAEDGTSICIVSDPNTVPPQPPLLQ